MNKICTSLEQSKKLIELGIDIDTADMIYYWFGNFELNDEWYELHLGTNRVDDKDIPAWSLGALMGLMPKLYEFENDPDDGGCQPNLCKGFDNNQWHIVYRSSIYITEWYDDPIDAAVEMVVWLKESKHI